MTKYDDQELFDDLSRQSTPERTSAAAARLRTAERRQVALRAVCLDDLVSNDHRVRMVWRFVEGLDLTALLVEIKAVEGRVRAIRRPILASCWRCGFTQRSRAWRARGKLRGCAMSMSRFNGCAAALA